MFDVETAIRAARRLEGFVALWAFFAFMNFVLLVFHAVTWSDECLSGLSTMRDDS